MIDPTTTLGFYFEVANSDDMSLQNRRRCIQFITTYTHPNGHLRMRVTTVSGAWHMEFHNKGPVAASFDQECAAVMIARLATQRLLEEVGSDDENENENENNNCDCDCDYQYRQHFLSLLACIRRASLDRSFPHSTLCQIC